VARTRGRHCHLLPLPRPLPALPARPHLPDHTSTGTTRSADWEEQYTLETGQGTTVLAGPAHLLVLLGPEPEGTGSELLADTDPFAPGTPVDKYFRQLVDIVDAALAELDENDLTGTSITAEIIQERANAEGLTVLYADAVNVLGARLHHRRTRLLGPPSLR
jgi:hypothetical protein